LLLGRPGNRWFSPLGQLTSDGQASLIAIAATDIADNFAVLVIGL
jgi:hypothetical protein